ncbi:MAG: hypothetical protein VB091_05825, partial [Christensenella sp.]|nr:hypothetical protein [Christensenella sp.]
MTVHLSIVQSGFAIVKSGSTFILLPWIQLDKVILDAFTLESKKNGHIVSDMPEFERPKGLLHRSA